MPRFEGCTLRSLAEAQQKRQNRFCKIEPSLATDSSEASEDGPEASDGRSDVGRLERQSRLRCACAWSRARAVGQPHIDAQVAQTKDCRRATRADKRTDKRLPDKPQTRG